MLRDPATMSRVLDLFNRGIAGYSRIPNGVKPISYKITLQPNFTTFEFEGRVEIAVICSEPSDEIILNCKDLIIHTVSIYSYTDKGYISSLYFVTDEILLINLDSPMLPVTDPNDVSAIIQISFRGYHRDNLSGFYRTLQRDNSYAVVCHFEPTGARSAFPCWDEPEYKAYFDVCLSVPKGYVAISNMPQESTKAFEGILGEIQPEEYELIIFQTTPLMSTYLMCCIVGHFDYIQDTTTDGIPLRIYTDEGNSELGRFALDIGIQALDFYKDFFGISYMLPKLDMIAIGDLPIKAMENWGILTFKEKYLLYNSNFNSKNTKKKITRLVTHHIAHQWFGNLVTMNWWTHLWLKEGFATWIQTLCTDFLFPEWNEWASFINETMNPALEHDALINSHPVQTPVEDPSEIGQIFDIIPYNKGASVIRMLYNWLGEEKFRLGIKNYLTKYSFSIATTDNLWMELESTSDFPVKDVMSTWVQHKGFPILSFSMSKNNKGISLSIEQEEVNPSLDESVPPTIWSIPINLKNKEGITIFKGIMKEKKLTIEINEFDVDSDFINFNSQCCGYFRVNYPLSAEYGGLKCFYGAIESQSICLNDRICLINDQIALTLLGKSNAINVLEFVKHFNDDDDYEVWYSISSCLHKFRILLLDEPQGLDAFNPWVCEFLSNPIHKFEVFKAENESYFVPLIRSLLLINLIESGDNVIIDACYKRFEEFKKNGDVLDADIVGPLYCAAMKRDSLTNFGFFLSSISENESAEERSNIYTSFGFIDEAMLLKNILQTAIDGTYIPNQDFNNILTSMSSRSALGRNTAWSFFKEQRYIFDEKYKSAIVYYPKLIKSFISNFGTQEAADEVENYFRAEPALLAQRVINEGIEKIDLLRKWRERDLLLTIDFLSSHS
ncbi:uncharacterized protein [Lepeophtheirus salmonis]|uniref:uncharacterized protein isoform X1 n=1 Tax=Lepeophtheirus salmonis TaxID=72036 RepID=UPI001AE56143|nr:aminopeptidase M1-B-like [Lepeophtheirus salmonis]